MSLPLLLIVVTLAAYRTWRLLGRDDWPPIVAARGWLGRRWEGSRWFDGVDCPWCLGSIIAGAYVAGVAQVTSVPLPGIAALAVACGVGLIGSVDR